MSDKSEIEAIRARDAGRKYVTGIVEAQVWQDRRALLAHVDALEARVARLEGALRAMVATGKYWQGPKNKKILDQAFAALDNRPCTCHPDDNPPRPCPQKYALSECIRAALAEVKGVC